MNQDVISFYSEVQVRDDVTEPAYRGLRGVLLGVSSEKGRVFGYAVQLHDKDMCACFNVDEVFATGKACKPETIRGDAGLIRRDVDEVQTCEELFHLKDYAEGDCSMRVLTRIYDERGARDVKKSLSTILYNNAPKYTVEIPYWKIEGWGEFYVKLRHVDDVDVIKSALSSKWINDVCDYKWSDIFHPYVGFIYISGM